MKTQTTTTTGVERVQALDWEQIGRSLSSAGNAVLSQLLSAEECQQLVALYPQNEPFRSHILMARHGFGRGEYKYFAYPLPTVIADLRSALYARLVPIANNWEASLRSSLRILSAPKTAILSGHLPDQGNRLRSDLGLVRTSL